MSVARRVVTRLLAAALVTTALVACTDPLPNPTPDRTPSTAPTTDVLDGEEQALAARVAALRASVAALRETLTAAATGDEDALERAGRLLAADLEAARDPAVARAAADAVADPEDATTTPPGALDATGGGSDDDEADSAGVAPLLPGPVVSRATTVSYGDLLTTTLAAAREAGSAGEPVARFLATPFAGDLGAWQRSPADLLALIGEAGTTPDVADAEAAVLALDGEAPRALAWVVHGLETPTGAAEAAGRAGAHLAVIELALEELS